MTGPDTPPPGENRPVSEPSGREAEALLDELVRNRTASRLRTADLSLFDRAASAPEDAASIRERLGWLTAPVDFAGRIEDLRGFAASARREGLTSVYLLGMGGSSLGAEVLRDVPLGQRDACRLLVLDTTDERAIRQATESLAPEQALFIVASKSGSTIEVTALEQHFWSVMSGRVLAPGHHFVAVTDPGSPLVELARERTFRRTFENPPDIGGRYSVFSYFGLVPGALLGIDLERLLGDAASMAAACGRDDRDNPGLMLGAFMAAHASAGRDKLTLLLPRPLAPLGAWIEQLVAESTGKQQRGVLPVVGEPLGEARDYGRDRAFVTLRTGDTGDLDAAARTLEAAGHPVCRVNGATERLGAEFFRWAFATAVAGVALGVNPFDEPDVTAAKERTAQQLDTRRRTGSFRIDPPFTRRRGYARREAGDIAAASPGRYLALLDYLPVDWRRPTVIERLRGAVRARTGLATTYGVGPRYLHSTGQYHKGGPNTGLFVLLTAADERTTPVPGADYSFSVLKQAQALGDFDALVEAGRAVIHYHIDDPSADYSETLEHILQQLRGS